MGVQWPKSIHFCSLRVKEKFKTTYKTLSENTGKQPDSSAHHYKKCGFTFTKSQIWPWYILLVDCSHNTQTWAHIFGYLNKASFDFLFQRKRDSLDVLKELYSLFIWKLIFPVTKLPNLHTWSLSGRFLRFCCCFSCSVSFITLLLPQSK